MKIIDSYTIYCDKKTKESDLSEYKATFNIERVEDYDGAFDLIPIHDFDEDDILSTKEKFVSDSKILDFDENLEDFIDIDEDQFSLDKSSLFGANFLDETINDFLWHHKVMNINEAWNITSSSGKSEKGEGVVIAHPDSGYIKHPELSPDESRILLDKQLDLVDEDYDADYHKATHGLATASVILGDEAGYIKGIAPKALLIPIRVAKVDKLLPTPVLFGGGMRRLRKSIEHAEKENADIVSISLGGIKSLTQSKALKKAINRAKNKGIIIMAAAGNRVRLVVYPAKYKNVISVAASNYSNSNWSGSSRGSSVDITAPGENVWKADIKTSNKVKRSSGTSYAVANTAGVAALWLGHWGKSSLIEIFGGKHKLVDGFSDMLKHSASTDHNLPSSGFGAGIVDAKKLLELNPNDFKS